jgi:hypothetical protein
MKMLDCDNTLYELFTQAHRQTWPIQYLSLHPTHRLAIYDYSVSMSVVIATIHSMSSKIVAKHVMPI